MSDVCINPFVSSTTFLNPPARVFLKAGFGGIGVLKKIGLLHLSNAIHNPIGAQSLLC